MHIQLATSYINKLTVMLKTEFVKLTIQCYPSMVRLREHTENNYGNQDFDNI